MFLTIEPSVTSERSSKLPYLSCQPWAKTAGDILPSHKLTNLLSLFVNRFVVAQSLKERSADALMHKNYKPRNKIKTAILHFDDVVAFSCVLCHLVAHLTFQMRKVLVRRNSNETARRSLPGGVDGWARDKGCTTEKEISYSINSISHYESA